MRSLRLPSRCRRSSCRCPGRGFRAPAFWGAVSSENITNSSPIHHSYERDLGLYNALGRAFLTPRPDAAFALLLEALRRIAGGATMTTPGGTRTPCQSVPATPRARRTGFYHRVAALTLLGGLRPFALPYPDFLSPPRLRSLRRAQNTG